MSKIGKLFAALSVLFSGIIITGSAPFLSKQIAQSLKLYYNVKDLSFYSQDGQQCTKYLWDDYSHFLYIKKDLLIKFLKDNNFGLVWYETGTRYGEFGKHETKLNPPFMDYKYAEVLSV